MKRKSKLTIAIATAALAAVVATVVYAQNNDKYSLTGAQTPTRPDVCSMCYFSDTA